MKRLNKQHFKINLRYLLILIIQKMFNFNEVIINYLLVRTVLLDVKFNMIIVFSLSK